MKRVSTLLVYSFICCLASICLAEEEETVVASEADANEYTEGERSHWSVVERSSPDVPEFPLASDQEWIDNPVDAFVLRNLQSAGLEPAPPADRRTLIRRVYFDLIGLPPSPKDVERFVAEP